MKTKFMITACLLVAMLVMAATTRVVVNTQGPGTKTVNTIGVGKPIHLECIGCLPASSTVIVSRVTGSATNALVTAVLTNGAYNAAISTVRYIQAGDTLVYSGGYTSGVVRLMLTAD